jgi:hypothetical protein
MRDVWLPDDYRQKLYTKLMNLVQRPKSVEEYSMEFEHMILKCSLEEEEELTVACYI